VEVDWVERKSWVRKEKGGGKSKKKEFYNYWVRTQTEVKRGFGGGPFRLLLESEPLQSGPDFSKEIPSLRFLNSSPSLEDFSKRGERGPLQKL